MVKKIVKRTGAIGVVIAGYAAVYAIGYWIGKGIYKIFVKLWSD